jgi:YggT family protein
LGNGKWAVARPCGEWRHLGPGFGPVKDRWPAPGPVGLFKRLRPANFRRSSIWRTLMRALLDIIMLVLQIYIWLLIAAAVLSWLVAFNVVNTRNQVVHMIGDFLYRLTEPLLRPIRSMLPNLGGIDVSPVILILLILFLENVIMRYIYPNVF